MCISTVASLHGVHDVVAEFVFVSSNMIVTNMKQKEVKRPIHPDLRLSAIRLEIVNLKSDL